MKSMTVVVCFSIPQELLHSKFILKWIKFWNGRGLLALSKGFVVCNLNELLYERQEFQFENFATN